MMSVLAGGICAGFLAYCVYFDRKRRSDPNFKTKLREKRLKEEIEKHEKTIQNDYAV
jgi:import receptor subunit TOM20